MSDQSSFQPGDDELADVQGHTRSYADTDAPEDVEGHKFLMIEQDAEDDVEGHLRRNLSDDEGGTEGIVLL